MTMTIDSDHAIMPATFAMLPGQRPVVSL